MSKLLIAISILFLIFGCMRTEKFLSSTNSNERVLTCFDAFGNFSHQAVAVGSISYNSISNQYTFTDKYTGQLRSVLGPCNIN